MKAIGFWTELGAASSTRRYPTGAVRLSTRHGAVPGAALLSTRLAGEVFNLTTPTASGLELLGVGGFVAVQVLGMVGAGAGFEPATFGYESY